MLVPPSYEDLVPLNHPVRVVNSGRERIDIRALERSYKGGATLSYQPRMLLKVIVYGYLRNVYSSRKIEQELCENMHFMWLSGGARPDHKTINDFRAKRLKEHLEEGVQPGGGAFGEGRRAVAAGVDTGWTKLEANANRYPFVWGNAIKVSRNRIARQLKELWAFEEEVNGSEESHDFPEERGGTRKAKASDLW